MQFSGLGVSEPEPPRLRQLEEEDRKLKQLATDLSLDKVMLQDVCSRKFASWRALDLHADSSELTFSVFNLVLVHHGYGPLGLWGHVVSVDLPLPSPHTDRLRDEVFR